MSKCWGHSLGDCMGKISGEHIVTAGFFSSGAVTVRGMRWCPSEPRTVGLKSLVANVLCEGHNSRLSPVDQQAIKSFHTLGEMMRMEYVRRDVRKRGMWLKPFIRQIDGHAFERWMVKTMVNVLLADASSRLRWVLNGGVIQNVPSELVEFAFGTRAGLPQGHGLYSAASAGARVALDQEGVSCWPVVDRNERVLGFGLQFRGFPFLLWMISEHPRSVLADAGQFLHRPHEVVITDGDSGRVSQRLRFTWV